MSLAESEGTVAFFQLCCEPALQPRAAQSISLVLCFSLGDEDEMTADVSSSSQVTARTRWLFCGIQTSLFVLSIHEFIFYLEMDIFPFFSSKD